MHEILKKLKKYIIILLGLYILGFILGLNQFDTIPESTLNNNDYSILNIMLNNFFVTFSALLITIITFGTFAVFMCIKEGFLLGKLLAHYKMSLWKLLIFGVLPHGIFEITGLLISLALGINVVIKIYNNFSKARLKKELKEVLNYYHEAVAPLILFAAFIECFLTPIFIRFFLD